MKVEAVNKPEAFTPITLTITVESQIEVDTLVAMARLDMTIPNVIQKEGGNYVAATQFVRGIGAAVRSV
jgi:hypothetical protein